TKKDDGANASVDQLITGHWNINRIQLRLYYNGVFSKDTIIKQTPKPENFVDLGSGGGFEYRFNTSTSDVGTYELIHSDSLNSYTATKTYKWKILTITPVLFTVMSTGTDPAFPGATVETYHTLVK
ncbi:MAG TPA: hypothetical protein VKH37_00275, partial [Ferruginibacter sp.]|nr:hypothetical protein [Ferruginibacter sp.]